MNYSRAFIEKLNKDGNFIQSNFEKVVRLLDVLDFIATELDPLGGKLVLKGGTAINLIYSGLARLSVDIDLDYIGSLDKETTIRDRVFIMDALDDYMKGDGYVVSSKSRHSVILDSRTYTYTNAVGNKDNIKVEINFIDRIHIGPTIKKHISYFGKEVDMQTLLEEELFGMKICALIDRSKPRDLFDVDNLKEHLKDVDTDTLRKMAVFYLSLDGIFEVDENLFGKVATIGYDDVKKELLPVLAKNSGFDLEETKASVIAFLKGLLVLTPSERAYLREFAKGNYDPSHLFDGDFARRAREHPMAKWRIGNINK